MIPEKLLQILKNEGPAAIATLGDEGPHLVNTWNSYISVIDNHLVFPAGGMNKTEANVSKNNKVLITLGSREVAGLKNQGAGFLIKGTVSFEKSGPIFDIVKKRFPWARAAVKVTVDSSTQTL